MNQEQFRKKLVVLVRKRGIYPKGYWINDNHKENVSNGRDKNFDNPVDYKRELSYQKGVSKIIKERLKSRRYKKLKEGSTVYVVNVGFHNGGSAYKIDKRKKKNDLIKFKIVGKPLVSGNSELNPSLDNSGRIYYYVVRGVGNNTHHSQIYESEIVKL